MVDVTVHHTPGPWLRSSFWMPSPHAVVDTESIYGGGARIGVIAHVVRAAQDGANLSEREANARLIVAAPQLLQELKKLIAFVGGMHFHPQADSNRADTLLASANDVIAKAEGR